MDEAKVYLVDDEAAVRRSISFMLRTAGYEVETFESGEDFLKVAGSLGSGCLLLDVRLGGIDGLEVQQTMRDRGILMPIVMITGHGDIQIAVRAMKAGAVDFIEKPFEKSTLVAAIEQARRHERGLEQLHLLAEEARIRLNGLTAREREVLHGLVEGHSNKVIAHDLGISPRTVEIHRANLLTRLSANSLSEALRIAFTARLGDLAG